MSQSETTKELEECYEKTKWYIDKLASYLSAITKIPAEDLKQEGFLGVVRARGHYNSKIASFFTYAQYWIKTYMYALAYKHSHAMKIPEEFNFIYARYCKRIKDPDMQSVENKIPVLAKEFGLTESRLERIVHVMSGLKNTCSMDSIETLVNDGSPDLCEICMQKSTKNLDLLKKTVSAEEYFVIDHMLGLEVPSPKTLNWVGNILGVTKERVRQIKNSGFRKFREAYLDTYGGEPGEEIDE